MLPLGLFSGILTGCERFDLKNLTRQICHGVGFAAMVVLLRTGHGLISLALVSLSAELGTGLLDYLIVRRLCPQLRISPSLVSKVDPREAVGFGSKTLLQGLSRAVIYRTSGLIVVFFLGPAVLAVYARQRALVMFAARLMDQYGRVFVPTSSILHAQGDLASLRRLAIQVARFGFYISLPIVAALAIAGGAIVNLWMGPDYEAPSVLAILAVGHLLSLANCGPYRILVGLSRHGWPALAELFCALGGIALGLLLVGPLGAGLLGAAVAVGLAVTIGGGLVNAVLICRALQVRLADYVRPAFVGPLTAVAPVVAILLLARLFLGFDPLTELVVGCGAGGLLILPIYWRYAAPETFKRRVQRWAGCAGSRAGARGNEVAVAAEDNPS